ncbi:MAG TPA: extracellular solute-binding protein [Sandaracinaceae bacterium LLY-WYZ-13_1]|nr:extracellular solute-binding protein [Sandaracinaceae bacterium LLY-WYZ-13_1]
MSEARRRARWGWIVAAALVLGGLDGAPASAQDTPVVVVWHAYTGGQQEALREVADRFEAANPDVRVRLVAQPFGAYASKLESAIPTGNGPDLFIDAHDRIRSFHGMGLLAPIAPTDPERFEARIAPAHRAALAIDGAIYGYPIALKAAALYVNQDLVGSEVTHLEALEELAGELGEERYALAMEAESAYWASSLFAAYGVSLLDEQRGWGLRGEEARRAVRHLHRLVERGAVPEESSGDLVKRLFSDGRAAAAISGPWLAPDLPPGLRWRVQPLPRVRATGEPMRSLLTVEGVYAAAQSRHPEAANRFAEFVAFGEGARIRARVARHVVTDRRAWEDPALAEDPFLQSFRAAAERATVMPTHPHMRMVFGPADRAIRKVLRGTATVEAALDEGQHRFDDVTRPLPEARSPSWGLAALGLLLLGLVLLMVHRLRDPATRESLRASAPAYKYVAHAGIAVGLLVILPLAVGAATSFFAGRGLQEMYFVGFANYLDILTARGGELLGHGSFWLVLSVTVLWTVLNVVLHLVIGVFLALLLHRPYLHLKGFYRVALILPWAVPNYVTALAWKGMFHRQFGAVNAILGSFGVEPISWFSQWITAFSANVATNVWLGFPFMMVVTLGALTAIPKDVYEAAAVDGANAWQRFRLITLPLLVPFLAPAVAMGSVWTFNMFNVVFLVSGGEPDGSTEILVSEAYRWAFTRGNQYGYAAAYAVLIFLILLFTTRLAARAREARA